MKHQGKDHTPKKANASIHRATYNHKVRTVTVGGQSVEATNAKINSERDFFAKNIESRPVDPSGKDGWAERFAEWFVREQRHLPRKPGKRKRSHPIDLCRDLDAMTSRLEASTAVIEALKTNIDLRQERDAMTSRLEASTAIIEALKDDRDAAVADAVALRALAYLNDLPNRTTSVDRKLGAVNARAEAWLLENRRRIPTEEEHLSFLRDVFACHPKQRRPNITSDGSEYVAGISFGVFRAFGTTTPSLNKDARRYPALARFFARAATADSRRDPDGNLFFFGMIQFQRNVECVTHEDSNNIGWSLERSDGVHTGGNLWIEDGPDDGLRVYRNDTFFDGRKTHKTLPFAGERFVRILFTHKSHIDVPFDVAKAAVDLEFPAWNAEIKDRLVAWKTAIRNHPKKRTADDASLGPIIAGRRTRDGKVKAKLAS